MTNEEKSPPSIKYFETGYCHHLGEKSSFQRKNSVLALMFILLKRTTSLDKWKRYFYIEPNTANLFKTGFIVVLSNYWKKISVNIRVESKRS